MNVSVRLMPELPLNSRLAKLSCWLTLTSCQIPIRANYLTLRTCSHLILIKAFFASTKLMIAVRIGL